jgi:hypothetical protein
MYFDGYHITIIGHKYLFQVTKTLGRVDALTSHGLMLNRGHHSRRRHRSHRSSLRQLLDVMDIHKTMHIIRIDWILGLAKHHLAE